MGFTVTKDTTMSRVRYVAGYVTKKLHTKQREDLRLAREYHKMSRRPGLGRLGIEKISRALESAAGMADIEATGDVPSRISVGKRYLPFDRYTRTKLREDVGFVPDYIEALQLARLSEFREAVQELQKAEITAGGLGTPASVTKAATQQQALNMEARENMKQRDLQ